MWTAHIENLVRQGLVATVSETENSAETDRRFKLTIFNAGEVAMEKSLMRFVSHPDGTGTVFMQSSGRCYDPGDAGSLIVKSLKYEAAIENRIILPEVANK